MGIVTMILGFVLMGLFGVVFIGGTSLPIYGIFLFAKHRRGYKYAVPLAGICYLPIVVITQPLTGIVFTVLSVLLLVGYLAFRGKAGDKLCEKPSGWVAVAGIVLFFLPVYGLSLTIMLGI